MKATLLIPIAALCAAAQPALAKDAGPAAKAKPLWSFAKCAVSKDQAKVSKFLDKSVGQEVDGKQVHAFARSFPACYNKEGNAAVDNVEAENIVGALSGATYIKQHRGKPLPDYSAVPPLVTNDTVAAVSTDAAKARLVLLAFGECIFRNQPNHARSFIAAKPMSDAANASLKPLVPMLGSCLPMKKGTQISLTKTKLRTVIGNAAYKLDEGLAALPAIPPPAAAPSATPAPANPDGAAS